MSKVRDSATVRVSKPVSGARQRRPRAVEGRARSGHSAYAVTVDPRVMEAARSIMRPGQRLEIVSETEVRLVNGD